jgi:hypothetical protein
MTLNIVCFSKDRPLQLHGYLSSLYESISDSANVCDISVIVRATETYQSAYDTVFREFPGVYRIDEQNFFTDLSTVLDSDHNYTAFGCDDVVFVNSMNAKEIASELDSAHDVLCITFRLGKNITRGMFGNAMPQPVLTEAGPFLSWDITHPASTGDWAYPWEVLGTVYRTDFVKQIVSDTKPNSPSQLEERGSHVWRNYTDQHIMASWQIPRSVIPTVNIVQREFANGFLGTTELDAPFLLDCWNHGLRLDVSRYSSATYESWRISDFFLYRP